MKQIKICGLKRPEDITIVNRQKPDYCGFIINFPKSHRNLSPDGVRSLKAGLAADIKAVGVFVNQPVELVAELLQDGTLDIAQLHGEEDNKYIAELRTKTTKPVWQAVRVRTAEDLKRAEESAADLVLLDAGQGSGESFDWSLLAGVKRPFALAGGLNADNLAAALQTKAVLLDVSGGVETDKTKDEKKIEYFINTVRKAE